MATARVTTDRVKKVTIDEYDQVFALTQYMINIGLENRFLLASGKTGSPLSEPWSKSKRSFGRVIDAQIGAPRIVVKAAENETLTGAYYMMCFDSGKLEVEYDIVPKPKDPKQPDWATQSFNLAGWQLAFHMMLGMDTVGAASDEFKDTVGTKAKVEDITLNSLVARFESAKLDFKECHTPDADWNRLPEQCTKNVRILIEEFQADLLAVLKGTETLGYAIKSQKPSEEAAKLTFEPNRTQYMAYPWKMPGAFDPKITYGLDGTSRLNCLLYAQTTGERELPTGSNQFLKWKGNFTDKPVAARWDTESGDFGSFFMTRRNFFDGYLAKKLQRLNKVFEPTLTTVRAKADNWVDPWYHWSCDLKIGQRSTDWENEFYKFKPVSPTEWVFKSFCKPPQELDKVGHDGWSAKLWSDASCSCENKITFEPGSDTVSLTGKSNIEFTMRFWNHHTFTAHEDWTHTRKWQTNWSLKLSLHAIDKGGLQILSSWGGVHTEIDNKGTDMKGLNEYTEYTQKAIEAAQTNMDAIRKELADDLAGQHGLVLPAKGIFFFKNPILGHDGDLICSLSYDDTPSGQHFDDPPVGETIDVKEGVPTPDAIAQVKFEEKK